MTSSASDALRPSRGKGPMDTIPEEEAVISLPDGTQLQTDDSPFEEETGAGEPHTTLKDPIESLAQEMHTNFATLNAWIAHLTGVPTPTSMETSVPRSATHDFNQQLPQGTLPARQVTIPSLLVHAGATPSEDIPGERPSMVGITNHVEIPLHSTRDAGRHRGNHSPRRTHLVMANSGPHPDCYRGKSRSPHRRETTPGDQPLHWEDMALRGRSPHYRDHRREDSRSPRRSGRRRRSRSPKRSDYSDRSRSPTPHHEGRRRRRRSDQQDSHSDSSDSSRERYYRRREQRAHLRLAPADSKNPLSREITNTPVSRRFKYPDIPQYDGSGDPHAHVQKYRARMEMQNSSDALLCKAFQQTLQDSAIIWYNELPRHSIYSFRELARLFCKHYMASGVQTQPSDYLLGLCQKESESIRKYLKRFQEERLTVAHCSNEMSMAAFKRGLVHRGLKKSLRRDPPRNSEEWLSRIRKFMIDEEAETKEEKEAAAQKYSRKKDRLALEPDRRDRRNPAPRGRDLSPRGRRDRQPEEVKFNAPLLEILTVAKAEGHLTSPPPAIRTPASRRDKGKYCRYHADHGHDTNDCFTLKRDLERMIERGYFKEFVANKETVLDKKDRKDDDREDCTNAPPQVTCQINSICGGPTLGGSSSSARKAYARSVMALDAGRKRSRSSLPMLGFTDDDYEGIELPHEDPLVVTAIIGSAEVLKLLVDNGSSCDIIFLSTIGKMNLSQADLSPYPGPIIGFTGHSAPISGTITLPVIVGEHPRTVTRMTKFVVINLKSPYNGILGRPFINSIKAAMSGIHLMLKFHTPHGIGILRGSQKIARSCYVLSVKNKDAELACLIETAYPFARQGHHTPQISSGMEHEPFPFLYTNEDFLPCAPTTSRGVKRVRPEMNTQEAEVKPNAHPEKPEKRGRRRPRRRAVTKGKKASPTADRETKISGAPHQVTPNTMFGRRIGKNSEARGGDRFAAHIKTPSPRDPSFYELATMDGGELPNPWNVIE